MTIFNLNIQFFIIASDMLVIRIHIVPPHQILFYHFILAKQ